MQHRGLYERMKTILSADRPFYACIATLAVVMFLVAWLQLPHHDNLEYDTWDESYEADITNYYWMDIPLKHGVWTYTIDYHTEHDLYTRVYPMNQNVDNAWVMYGIGDSRLPHFTNTRTFTIYVIDDAVPTGVEVRGEVDGGRHAGDAPAHISFTYRPRITLIYMLYKPFLILLLLIVFRRFIRYVRDGVSPEEQRARFSLLLIVIFVSTPLFVYGTLRGHDTSFHMMRIQTIADGLRSGIFPVKLQSGWFNHYGYPNGVFYPDALLYIPAVLRLLNLPIWLCFNAYILLTNTIATAVSYHCFRKISEDCTIGAVGSILYSASAWFLTDTYMRGAVGETTAMAFLPFVILGFFELMKAHHKDAILYLVCGYTGLLQSHILMPVMAAIFSVIVCVICVKTLLTGGRLRTLMTAAGYALLINLGVLVPFVDYYMRGIKGAGASTDWLQEKGVSLAQMLMMEPENRIGRTFLVRFDWIAGEMPHTAGVTVLLLLAAAVYVLVVSKDQDSSEKHAIRVLAISGVFSVWLSSDLFPYAWLEKHMPVVYKVFANNIQFPVRYHTTTIALLVAAGVCVMAYLKKRSDGEKRLAFIIAAFAVLLTIYQGGYLMSGWINTSDTWKPYMAKDMTEIDYDEYPIFSLPGSEITDVDVSSAVTSSDDMILEDIRRKGFTFDIRLQNKSDSEQYVQLPVWNYYGYRTDAADDGIGISDGEHRRVRISVPAGYAGEVRVRWSEPVYWRMSEIVSVVSAILFLYLYVARGKRRFLFIGQKTV